MRAPHSRQADSDRQVHTDLPGRRGVGSTPRATQVTNELGGCRFDAIVARHRAEFLGRRPEAGQATGIAGAQGTHAAALSVPGAQFRGAAAGLAPCGTPAQLSFVRPSA
mmetsp:Transcript_26477/g.84224  ORF Transcript_26477/g.84224 Transcript_26477/m.84224 type:complete len:109 (-) Transcript_26477:939-1265(-)